MSYTDFIGWIAYFEARPIGWREDTRTFKLLQAQGYKGKGEEVFASLAAIKAKSEEAAKDKGPVGLANSAFFIHMLNAKGSDYKLEGLC